MMKHIAVVEQSWFEDDFVGGGLMPPFDTVDWDVDRDWEWHSAAHDSPDELFTLWNGAVERSRALVDEALARGGVEQPAQRAWEDGRAPSLRWILCHMIEEYARHNGHADLLRESIDGETGE
jgi:hypothetical protein